MSEHLNVDANFGFKAVDFNTDDEKPVLKKAEKNIQTPAAAKTSEEEFVEVKFEDAQPVGAAKMSGMAALGLGGKIDSLFGPKPEDKVETGKDENGNDTRTVTEYNRQGEEVRKTKTTYGSNGEVTSTFTEHADGSTYECKFEYDANGNVKKEVKISRDQDGNIKNIETVNYSYDENGNITGRVDEVKDKYGDVSARYIDKYENGKKTSEIEQYYDGGRFASEVETKFIRNEEGDVYQEVIITTTYDPNNGEIQEQTTETKDVPIIKASKGK